MNDFIGGSMLALITVVVSGWVVYLIVHPILCGLATLKKYKPNQADVLPVRVEKDHPSAFHHV